MLVDVVDGGQDSLLEFVRGGDADMSEHGAGELGEEALDQVEPGAMLRREDEREAAFGLGREPRLGLPGDVGGMIVEDHFDRGMSRISGIEELEEFDEFATAMAVLDQGMDLAGQQVDPGQQAEPWRWYS